MDKLNVPVNIKNEIELQNAMELLNKIINEKEKNLSMSVQHLQTSKNLNEQLKSEANNLEKIFETNISCTDLITGEDLDNLLIDMSIKMFREQLPQPENIQIYNGENKNDEMNFMDFETISKGIEEQEKTITEYTENIQAIENQKTLNREEHQSLKQLKELKLEQKKIVDNLMKLFNIKTCDQITIEDKMNKEIELLKNELSTLKDEINKDKSTLPK